MASYSSFNFYLKDVRCSNFHHGMWEMKLSLQLQFMTSLDKYT